MVHISCGVDGFVFFVAGRVLADGKSDDIINTALRGVVEDEARLERVVRKRKLDEAATAGSVKDKQASHGAWSSMGGGGGGGITIKDARRSVESRGDVEFFYFRTERGHRQHRRREQEQEAARLAAFQSSPWAF